ncbi:class I SAM-dependent methyltransferase [Bacillus sp. T3]|uniref:class I SAM-dependent methyltransferase n=1 Tax=Bacillus sp. T3 TaxID=467262 RepID=UPI0029811BAB|nr:class I SAM-dependent methyltransferase [Bacillus sp. T3]
MMNSWNKFIYKIWSPFYDKIFNSGVFLYARKQLFKDIAMERNQKLLFVGVGTGADLELIDLSSLDITAIDYSPAMLDKARTKFKNSQIHFLEMDAQNLEFNNHSFDYIIASLIVSVVPDAKKCFQEMTRVLKPGGKIILFDKFSPKDKELSLMKKILRPLIRVLGTDIGLSFEDLFHSNNQNLQIVEDQPVLLNGMYRRIVIRK